MRLARGKEWAVDNFLKNYDGEVKIMYCRKPRIKRSTPRGGGLGITPGRG
jgi:hypothetical protein